MKEEKQESMGGKSRKGGRSMGKKVSGFGAKLGKGKMGKSNLEGPFKK